ncbi:phosphopantetheine adenylyltransferase [archaeon BMS3Abin16]|nr:phosphopantetheine adenylyltransferase [archaeon BMS3Abin16]
MKAIKSFLSRHDTGFCEKDYVHATLACLSMKMCHTVLGGTFDRFHLGHERLIERAVEIGDFVTIGITSDRFSGKDVEPFETRQKAVERYLKSRGCEKYRIVVLNDPFGPTLTDHSMDRLIVSEETYLRALELNRLRTSKGLKELEIIRMPMVGAEDGRPISSSRIRQGEINRTGCLIKKG